MGNWHNVSKKEPCPICRKTDWCNLSDDGAVCICHRVESDRLAPSGSGWIHRLRDVEKKVKVRGEGEQWKVHFSQAARTPLLHSVLDFGRVHGGYDGDAVLVEGSSPLLRITTRPASRARSCWPDSWLVVNRHALTMRRGCP